MHGADELEAAGVIHDLARRFTARSGEADDPRALRDEIDRLRGQNEKMRQAIGPL